MPVARACFVNKSAALMSSLARKTSCSRGWLHVTVQGIFAVITTVSFTLIVLMSVRNPTHSPPASPTKPTCFVNFCRVVCHGVPFYNQHEKDLFMAVADAEMKCNRVTLELHNALFENNTLPSNWLSRMQSDIYQLSIINGNLNHISPTAFMSQFTGSIRVLLLQDLQLDTWETNSLVGLSSLETLNIINCEIGNFQTDSIRAVDDTLETLTITESGYWNPTNVTGSRGFEKLTIVNFSNNEFSQVLGKNSFVGLELCKIIYLNSCGIVSIGAGAFDTLTSIEVIYLNYNLLVTVPTGLFDNIVLNNPRPRISLQENYWHCDCDKNDLRQLVRKEILLVEAVCTYPSIMNGKTFTELENFCSNKSDDSSNNKGNKTVSSYFGMNYHKIYVNGECRKNVNKMFYSTKRTFKLVSPQENNKCSLDITKNINISALTIARANNIDNFSKNFWLKFSFLLQTTRYNALHIESIETRGFGLLWFQSDCPYEMYCIDNMPKFLRVYNIDEKSQFTFCPLQLKTGEILEERCIGYAVDEIEKYLESRVLNWLIWSMTALLCICFGATIVYGLIRMNPILLKGSKRILFVKHKMVDALVLPPKIPLRNDLINDAALDSKQKEIFTLCATKDDIKVPKMGTMKSVRSNKSGSPSYISALQPSEDQLAEWRISHHFNNDLTISSRSELSTLSWICDNSYHSLDESDRTYESLK